MADNSFQIRVSRPILFNMVRAQSQGGFTLIELLVVVALLSVLTGISIQSFREYKARAYYAVADESLRNARTVLEASLLEPDVAYEPVDVSQATPGRMTDPDAYALLGAYQNSKNTKISVFFDPSCPTNSSLMYSLQVNNCQAEQYVMATRFCDGVQLVQQHIDGPGCP